MAISIEANKLELAHSVDNGNLLEEQEQHQITLEPISLSGSSEHSDHSENVTSSSSGCDNSSNHDESANAINTTTNTSDYDSDPEPIEAQIKCSAVHSLERDMPDFDYSHLIIELRKLILEHAQSNVGLYSPHDVDKCAHDDWHLARFLLRHKLDLGAAFEMLKSAMRFNHESLANHLKPEDFPAEFYQLQGLFPYGADRKGNKMLWMRVRIHKKTPEIAAIVQAFIYFNIKRLDEQAQGRGISIVFDCSGGGLANADMDTLLFIVSTLKNYFPKGLSYFLVHEIPWILKPFWHIAKAWVPEEHRQLIKFSDSTSIYEYVDKENLPEYLGGPGGKTSMEIPENCTTLEQAVKLWGIEMSVLRRVMNKFREHLPRETVERIENYFNSLEAENNSLD